MNEQKEKFYLAAIVVLALAVGFLFYRQESAFRKAGGGGAITESEVAPAPVNQAEETKKEILGALFITGSVERIDGSVLEVNATLVDVSKLDDFDYSKPALLPALEKKYRVRVGKNTIISVENKTNASLEDIKLGMLAQVTSS